MKALWPHQERAIAMLRRSLASGKRRPVLQCATGAGKTVIAAAIFRSAREKNPNVRLLFIVDAIGLIDQTVKAFYEEGLYGIGVIQADHQMQDWSKPIQVASVQTLQRRRMFGADIVIVDEAHRQNDWLFKVMASEEWKDKPIIGLSATPWSRGLGHHYDDLIIPVSMQELIDAGHLCPFRVFASGHPDLTGVKVQAGDYQTGQLSTVMQESGLVADIVDTWRKSGEGRPTFVFCVDRAHAKKVQLRFEGAGIPCGYIDAFTERNERLAIRGQLERGEIKVVANVACLTTGVDWPVGCIVLARPTRSEMLFVQMIGRGLRCKPDGSDCIILDHADNTLRLGFPTDIQHDELCTAKAGERAKPERKEALPKECSKCTYIKPPKVHECPSCGFKPERQSRIEEGEGELVQLDRRKVPTRDDKQKFWSMALAVDRHRNKGGRLAKALYKGKFGVWPKGLFNGAIQPDAEFLSYEHSRRIAYAKRREVEDALASEQRRKQRMAGEQAA